MPCPSGAFVPDIKRVSRTSPFPLCGIDYGNDSAFMNEAFLQGNGYRVTRSLPYKKNNRDESSSLVAITPAMCSSAELRTLQRRVKAWRSNRASELVNRISVMRTR
ncbi:hypothetical protein [Paraburkholderia caledonica]|uniref:hypothetical protein n=1 Tax=Paraburkholderia caledonica TaxID=134536 RepID=UPI0012602F50|nr:hypothetical protein [Paraburkholderia caledonica]